MIISPNNTDRSKQEGKEYQGQGIGAIEAFKYENARHEWLCCIYWEKWKAVCQTTAEYTRDPRGIFTCSSSFTDSAAVQFDVQV